MSKEHFIAAHEQLIEEYLNDHPDAEWSEAYERTGDAAYERMRDNFASMIDAEKERRKYGNA